MFYFKMGSVNLDRVDPAQLQAVRDFQARVRADGVLTRDFKATTAYEAALRVQLQLLPGTGQKSAAERGFWREAGRSAGGTHEP